MKKYYFKLVMAIVILLFATNVGFSQNAQNPSIEWQKCMGGSNEDEGNSIIQTTDGGFISVGITTSTDFDAIENHSISNVFNDLFVVKFSDTGNIEWKKCLGGTKSELYPSIKQTIEGGYIISSITNSNDGDVSGHHNPNGWDWDTWIVKLDNLGNIIWQKCYGGTGTDNGRDLIQTTDGGYVFAGDTRSYDGDLANINFYENSHQGWIVKIDSIGTIQWQKLIGGTGEDLLTSIKLTDDGGFIVAGVTSSHDGDVFGNIGVESAWVVKLSNTGSIQWQKCIGSGNYSRATDVKQCSDGGYIVACEKMVPTGTEMGYSHGYVVKLTSIGNVEWEKQLGGNRDDFLNSIQETSDGGFIVGGSTYSWSGDLQGTSMLGFLDCWIVKLSSIGNIEWQRRFGGNGDDLIYSIQQTSDLGFIFTGKTKSKNHDVIGLHQSLSTYTYSDMWVVKLSPTVSTELYETVELFQLFPNPAQDYLNLQIDPSLLNHSFQIFSITGQLVLSGNITSETMELQLGSISNGIYLFKIGDQTKKIIKTK